MQSFCCRFSDECQCFCRVDATNTVKITDAVFSWDFYGEEYMFDSSRDRFLPIRWMAPESLMDGYYDRHSDVVSATVCEWLAQHIAEHACNMKQLLSFLSLYLLSVVLWYCVVGASYKRLLTVP